MHDLVGSYERLTRIYQLYIESAFPLRSAALTEERRTLLRQSAVLSQPPLLETVPVYETVPGMDLRTASRELGPGYQDLHEFARDLIPPGRELYKHQWESLQTVLVEKRDIVVTTGTGSGKTECFLLPLLAEIARESKSWSACPDPPPDRKWYEEDATNWRPQWHHAGRHSFGQHAVRGLILYPLNALVEDQLRRLRRTLDSDRMRNWMVDNRGRNHVTFGRYTGHTPVPGVSNRKSQERLRNRLRKLALATNQFQNVEDDEIRYYFSNMDGGEAWSRWDMQATPPDILITNYSMLNIMLMREIENNIFDQTRRWLMEDRTRRFFLIVDELHAYRGTPGTEVAYILRLLLSRLGLDIESDQLSILATSASVEDDPAGKSRSFLGEFFGRDRFRIIGEPEKQPPPNARRKLLTFRSAFEQFAEAVQPDVLDPMRPPDRGTASVTSAMNELAFQLGHEHRPDEAAPKALYKALSQPEVDAPEALRDAIREVSGSLRPTQIPSIDKEIFSDGSIKDQIVSKAMRGLLLALGMSHNDNLVSPQPVRGHFFFHNLQNLWVCINPNCTHGNCNLQMRSKEDESGSRVSTGALFASQRISCEGCGGRVLDLIVCEVCGEILVGGFRNRGVSVETLTADLPDLENVPDKVSLNQRHSNYAVFWPTNDEIAWNTAPEDIEYTADKIRYRWVRARLNVFSGVILFDASEFNKEEEIAGWTISVPGTPDVQQRAQAIPHKCPKCDTRFRAPIGSTRHRTPLRNHRTGFQKACQVISSGLAREMPLEMGNAPSRKLVIFSDSRQDAAKLAAGVERDHYRDMLRVALFGAIDEHNRGLVTFIKQVLPATNEAAELIEHANPILSAHLADERFMYPAARNRFAQSNQDLIGELMLWLSGMPQVSSTTRLLVERMVSDYPYRIPFGSLRATIWRRFLEIGTCPGGTEGELLFPREPTGRYTSSEFSWTDCFDWASLSALKSSSRAAVVNHITKLENRLMAELMYAMFPHKARTYESLGQGWVTFRNSVGVSPSLEQAADSVIRQLGSRRLYKYSRGFHPGDSEIRPTIYAPGNCIWQSSKRRLFVNASGNILCKNYPKVDVDG